MTLPAQSDSLAKVQWREQCEKARGERDVAEAERDRLAARLEDAREALVDLGVFDRVNGNRGGFDDRGDQRVRSPNGVAAARGCAFGAGRSDNKEKP